MKRAFSTPNPHQSTTHANENAKNMLQGHQTEWWHTKAYKNDAVLMDGAVFDILLASLELMAL